MSSREPTSHSSESSGLSTVLSPDHLGPSAPFLCPVLFPSYPFCTLRFFKSAHGIPESLPPLKLSLALAMACLHNPPISTPHPPTQIRVRSKILILAHSLDGLALLTSLASTLSRVPTLAIHAPVKWNRGYFLKPQTASCPWTSVPAFPSAWHASHLLCLPPSQPCHPSRVQQAGSHCLDHPIRVLTLMYHLSLFTHQNAPDQ